MELKLNRTTTTRLYTLGELFINGMKTTDTVEDTLSMLEAGTYKVCLSKGKSRRREIAIIPNPPHKGGVGGGPYRFEPNGSHISSRKHHSICIGEWIIPGALKNGLEPYNRLFDRIEKAEARKEETTLIIIDSNVESHEPVSFWDQPSDHGCPPTKKRVELNDDDSVDIYDGNVHIRHLTVEEQRELMNA